MKEIKNYVFELALFFIIFIITLLCINRFPDYTLLITSFAFILIIALHYLLINRFMNYIKNLNNKIINSKSVVSQINNQKNPLYVLDSQMDNLMKNLEKEIFDASQLSRVKSEFLSNVSHEFKTPIFTITGLVDTLLEGAVNDKEVNRKFLNKIKRQTNRLENLFSDLIIITKLESDSMNLKKNIISLDEIFDWVIDNYNEKAVKKGLRLLIPLKTNISIYGDKESLKSVFSNLVDNAINYSNSGDIIVSAKKISNIIKVKVVDNGIGIPIDSQSKIFERFYRVDKDRSRKTGGSGLGLSIVKHILLSHNSQIEINSKEGVGTEFSFELETLKS